MNIRIVLVSVLLVFVSAFAAETKERKAIGPKLFLNVTVERVKDDYLVVMLDGYAEEQKDGRLQFYPDRAHSLAILVPGGKCASGDKFTVWAYADGIQSEPGKGNQPLRRFAVISAKRK